MFWTKNLPLAVPLPTQEYKWVLTNCQGSLMKCWGLTLAMDQLPIQGKNSDTPDWLMLSSGWVGHFAPAQTFEAQHRLHTDIFNFALSLIAIIVPILSIIFYFQRLEVFKMWFNRKFVDELNWWYNFVRQEIFWWLVYFMEFLNLYICLNYYSIKYMKSGMLLASWEK